MYQLVRLYKGKVVDFVSENFSSWSEANAYLNTICYMFNDVVLII